MISDILWGKIKGYIYGTIIISVILSSVYAIRTWHYIPIQLLQDSNDILKNDLIEQTKLLGICETKLHKVNLDGFIEGIGENNETIVIDFDNLIY